MNALRAQDTHPSAGFTLVELIYVVVIVGIVAGMAAPLFNVDRFRVNSAVLEVSSEFLAAQRSAIMRGHDVVIAINQAQNRLRIHTDANNDGQIQSDEIWKVLDLPEGVTFGRSSAPALSAASGPITFTKKQGVLPAITFHRNGSASEMGFLYLTGVGGGDQGKNTRALEVVRSTAKVTRWTYQTGSWTESN